MAEVKFTVCICIKQVKWETVMVDLDDLPDDSNDPEEDTDNALLEVLKENHPDCDIEIFDWREV